MSDGKAEWEPLVGLQDPMTKWVHKRRPMGQSYLSKGLDLVRDINLTTLIHLRTGQTVNSLKDTKTACHLQEQRD